MNVNRGYTFGYWGEYNRASNALAAMPEVKVTRSWYHDDVTLEIFSFALIVDDRPLQLDFPSFDPIRELSGEQLSKAMEVRVREKFVERYGR